MWGHENFRTTEQEAPYLTALFDLNICCLMTILRMLSLDELTIVSDVCQKFKYLAAEAFKYKWKSKTIMLSNKDRNTKLVSTAILRNFGNQLQKVEIIFGEHGNDKFFKLFIDKCSSQLTQLDISTTCVSVKQQKILSEENIHRLNVKFGNLQRLQFERSCAFITEPECIEQNFIELKELRLYDHPFENRNIFQFIKFNPQIKRLFCFNKNNVIDAVAMIEMIDQQLPRLEQLGLWIYGQADENRFQSRFLKALTHLSIRNNGNTSNLQHLSISTESLEDMTLEMNSCDENLIDFICQHEGLTKLCIRIYNGFLIDSKLLLGLKKHSPKLNEFEIYGFWKDFNLSEIVHFLYGWSRLVKFTLFDANRKNILGDMEKLQSQLSSTKWVVSYNALERQLHFVNKEIKN